MSPPLSLDTYMTRDDLEAFISRDSVQLSTQEREYLLIRRRRLSIERKSNVGRNAVPSNKRSNETSAAGNETVPLKVMMLGDEGTSGKIDMMNLFCHPRTHSPSKRGSTSGGEENLPFGITRKTIILAGDDREDTGTKTVELWVPSCSSTDNTIRSVYYPGTDCFIVLFSISDSSALSNIRSFWSSEIIKHQASTLAGRANIPVILVGNYAEKRNNNSLRTNLVTSQEAVSVAQACGFLKYIEVFSYNTAHIHEIFKQSVRAVINARSNNGTWTSSDYDHDYQQHSSYLSEFLTLEEPVGEFLSESGIFEFKSPTDGSCILYSTHEETYPNMLYSAPIHFYPPYPKVVRAIRVGRCRYSSSIAIFHLADQLIPRNCHFDLVGRSFVIPMMVDDHRQFYYTLDGSTPNPLSSRRYNGISISLDNADVGGTQDWPELLTVLAIDPNKTGTEVALFYPPKQLPCPVVSFDRDYGTLTMALPTAMSGREASMTELRFTTDGSRPSWDLPLYSGHPIQLIQPYPRVILAATFPQQRFVSPVVAVDVGTNAYEGGIVLGNRMLGVERSRTEDVMEALDSTLQIIQTSPEKQPKLIPKHNIEKPRVIASKPSERRSSALPSAVRPSTGVPIEWSSTAAKDLATAPRWMARCHADANSIHFSFERPVKMERITVTTPGNRHGPAGYEVLAMLRARNSTIAESVLIAKGLLEDFIGEQDIDIDDRVLYEVPGRGECCALKCIFYPFPGEKTFQIRDIHLFGTNSVEKIE